ncbi:MAG: glycosylphosphatidylinositol anchor biosynthesis [Claussenomyces sp. TS43310]|nr:MAG: glycosylphosphatidylinositol anchor biosynthesis [Claussenomyces sp. TS43310]
MHVLGDSISRLPEPHLQDAPVLFLTVRVVVGEVTEKNVHFAIDLMQRSKGNVSGTDLKYHPVVHAQLAKDVLALAVGVRLLNALCVSTFFQPDEYFQALEPAWEIAFGSQSGAWITWEWQNQLRSSLHPLIFASVYSLLGKAMGFLSFFPQFRAIVLVAVPRLIQGFFAAAGDYYTWKFAENIYGYGSDAAWTAFVVSLLSPWHWFCSTRTLSNSLETVLTIVALNYWPWSLSGDMPSVASRPQPATASKDAPIPQSESSGLFDSPWEVNRLRYCLLLAGIASILRPTNLLIWISLAMASCTRIGMTGSTRARFGDLLILLKEILLCGSAVILLSAISDRLYYGMWSFPAYQWLNFNITQSLAVFYGTNDWHYYLSQGLPLLLTTYLPFAVAALWSATSISSSDQSSLSANIRFQLSFTTVVMIATLSLISHKEVRFIYPLLPGLHVLAAPQIISFIRAASTQKVTSKNSSGKKSWRSYVLIVCIITNLGIGAYTTLVHQRGVISVLSFLRQEYELAYFKPGLGELMDSTHSTGDANPRVGDPNEMFAAFLMPCHSTPWRSHLVHPTLRAWALTCEPPLHIPANSTERAAYRDEADRFYDDQIGFLRREVNTKEKPWPRYVVGFEGIGPTLQLYYAEVMPGWIVQERWRGFNTHWHDDQRRSGDVVVWEFVDASRSP